MLPLQLGLIAASNQLQRLHDELDFANATRPQLDVVGKIPALYLCSDQCMHLAKRFENSVVEIATVYERRNQVCVQLLGVGGPRCDSHDARLNIGIALPATAMLYQVRLQRSETDDRRPAVAEGSQSGIDAEHEAIGRILFKQRDDESAHTREILLCTERSRTIAFAAAGVQEYQVNVRRKIEFVPTELAHPQNDDRNRFAFFVTNFSESMLHFFFGITRSRLQQPVRQVRKRA